MRDQRDTVIVHRHYTSGGDLPSGLDALADAVVLMSAGAPLDDAVQISRDRVHRTFQQQARLRGLDAQIAVLRAQLAVLEDQAHEGAV